MSTDKDYKELVDKVRKFAKEVADNNSYREYTHKHLKIKFDYKEQRVVFTFALTPSDRRSAINDRAKVRRKLRELGLSDPRFGMKLITATDVCDALLEDLYSTLGKPYRKEVSYLRNGKEITYHRYYVSQRRYGRDSRYREGFYPATEQQYDEAVKIREMRGKTNAKQ